MVHAFVIWVISYWFYGYLLFFLQVDGTTENKSLNGARIGVVAKPSAEFVAGVLAVWLSGGVAVPLALSYPEAELFHVMTDSVLFVF